jgi:hypothetical protein
MTEAHVLETPEVNASGTVYKDIEPILPVERRGKIG